MLFQLDVLGGGRFLRDYERDAKRRGLNDLVTFHGAIPRSRVLELFKQCDLFVMPSRTEGLPRAMIEAMAQGLPCIGTRVGGIPELLDDAALVPVDDVRALSDRIAEFLANPVLYSTQAAGNLRRSQDFLVEKIDERRLTFHSALRAALGGDP